MRPFFFLYVFIAVNFVSGHLGYYDKILQMGWLINDRNLLLTAMGMGSSMTVLEHSACWWGPASGFIRGIVWLFLHVVGGAREFCGVSFIRTLIPLTRGPLS